MMKSFECTRFTVLLAALLSAMCGPACAVQQTPDPDDPPVQVVHVDGLRDPDGQSYRRMIKGMDQFEKFHHLAPDAVLRYKLIARLPGVKEEGTRLAIQGNKLSMPIALASDMTFTLPRNAEAWEDNARVTANRTARSFVWGPDVRTPGLPPDTRRLGDLRLECEIDRAATLLVGLKTPSYYLIDAAVDVCTVFPGSWLYYGERAVFNVTLVHGSRRQVSFSPYLYGGQAKLVHRFYDFYPMLHDRLYVIRVADASWPDDTLVELEYMESP